MKDTISLECWVVLIVCIGSGRIVQLPGKKQLLHKISGYGMPFLVYHDSFPLFNELVEDCAPPINYTINGNNYSIGYYLADEFTRKDVERAFGVLQSRFAIVHGSTLYWETDTLSDIMIACVILHNMIVEDERDNYSIHFNYDTIEGYTTPNVSHILIPNTLEYFHTYYHMRDRQGHSQLQTDLSEHLWQLYGGD
ncbi:uncharacterized protein LOC120002613 [Tripterygium wilfordii]|uniref:uncharacterized protein LOC120002613 n=1 Tax=Tripterygium wilfordii TaxID=458696 RepID=UPI0018F8184C|nr:uncharacterized protein LOC120002613 [Tripterygium wilfordii]